MKNKEYSLTAKTVMVPQAEAGGAFFPGASTVYKIVHVSDQFWKKC